MISFETLFDVELNYYYHVCLDQIIDGNSNRRILLGTANNILDAVSFQSSAASEISNKFILEIKCDGYMILMYKYGRRKERMLFFLK